MILRMRIVRVAGLVLSGLIVVLAGLIAISPARQYVPEMTSRVKETTSAVPAAPVTDLSEVGQLQSAFNADAGSSRLVILLSPT